MEATIEEAVMVLQTIRRDKEKIIENEKRVIVEVFGKVIRKWFDKNKDISKDVLCREVADHLPLLVPDLQEGLDILPAVQHVGQNVCPLPASSSLRM